MRGGIGASKDAERRRVRGGRRRGRTRAERVRDERVRERQRGGRRQRGARARRARSAQRLRHRTKRPPFSRARVERSAAARHRWRRCCRRARCPGGRSVRWRRPLGRGARGARARAAPRPSARECLRRRDKGLARRRRRAGRKRRLHAPCGQERACECRFILPRVAQRREARSHAERRGLDFAAHAQAQGALPVQRARDGRGDGRRVEERDVPQADRGGWEPDKVSEQARARARSSADGRLGGQRHQRVRKPLELRRGELVVRAQLEQQCARAAATVERRNERRLKEHSVIDETERFAQREGQRRPFGRRDERRP